MSNVELKAYLDDPGLAHDRLTARGMRLARDHIETDTYFQTVVSKRRRTYEAATALVNIDSLFGEYHFVEIEARYDDLGGEAGARAVALDLMTLLDIKNRDIVSSSYEHLATVLSGAQRWRRALTPALERLVLIDGPSGAGKSTLVADVTSDSPTTSYVRRTTSRERRNADSAHEYEFISVDAFIEAERAGDFLEAREFLFDMRYGIRWASIEQAVQNDRVGLGVMNLGNIRHVGVVAPEVTTVLVTAPLETLRRRISARGTHSPEAIEERLGNAATVQTLADLYDYVLVNDDGDLEMTQKALQDILDGVRRK